MLSYAIVIMKSFLFITIGKIVIMSQFLPTQLAQPIKLQAGLPMQGRSVLIINTAYPANRQFFVLSKSKFSFALLSCSLQSWGRTCMWWESGTRLGSFRVACKFASKGVWCEHKDENGDVLIPFPQILWDILTDFYLWKPVENFPLQL